MQLTFFKQFDWILAVSAILLTLFGIVSMMSTAGSGSLLSRTVLSQSIFLVLSIILFFFVASLEYRSIQSFTIILYGIGLLLLIAVLFLGEYRNGSRAWFNFGLFSMQPSEFAKLFTILVLAWFFSKKSVHTASTILTSLLFIGPIALLIILEPDIGTLLAYIALWCIMILALSLTTKTRILFILSIVGIVIAALFFALNYLSTEHFQIKRLLVYPDHLLLRNTYHTEIGYQVDQSIIAIGSGGLMGKGLGHGSQSQFAFLPAQTTDFIFASITEEIGFVGALVILSLLLVILVRTLQIARIARDRFGFFICVGVFGLILYHSFQNIGMNIGLLPVTGIPFSFLSYGGSHLLTVYASLGLVESVALRAKNVL